MCVCVCVCVRALLRLALSLALSDCLCLCLWPKVAGLALVGATDALTVTPKPQSVTVNELMGVSPQSFDFAATGANSGYLRDAFTRYYGILFTSTKSEWLDTEATQLELRAHAARGGSVAWETVTGIDVNVKLNDTKLSLETDESYTLTIKAPRASIEANSVFGAMHALESFSQLVDRGSLVNGTVIVDKPRDAFRYFSPSLSSADGQMD